MAAKNLSATVNRSSLPTCWVKYGDNYIFMKKGGKMVRQSLPYVSIGYKQVLENLKIPYEVIQMPNLKFPGKIFTACAFWDPKSYWVQTKTLPVYKQVSSTKDIFVRTGEMHEGKVFGSQMIAKAMEKKKLVMAAVDEIRRAREKVTAPIKMDEEFLRKTLDGKSAKVVKLANSDVDGMVDIGSIKIIPAYHSNGTKNGYYGIFDMAKLEYVSVIKVVVPKEEAYKIYGAKKMNQQYWEYCCGKGIEIIPVKG